jgi:hypothetical protein
MDSIPVCSDDSSTIIANPASFDPQPYLVYDSIQEALDPNPVVDLEDQFGLKEDVPVVNQGYFMNPVQKQPIEPEGEPELVTDPVLHYRWLGLDPSSPEGPTVLVTDQFGDNVTWVISKIPLYLLAPTSKLVGPGEPGPPPAGQHYTCYIEVGSLVDPAATVQLSDQFALHGPLEVGRAFFLCAPAEKTHDGDVYPIIPASDGRDHLACYEVPMESHVVTVSTRNQFSGLDPDEFGSPVWDRMLCVPAIKTHPGFFPPVPSLRPGGIVALGLLMLLTTFWVVQRRLRCARAA